MILSLETTSLNCSVSLSTQGELLALREEQGEGYIHSERLHVLIDELLKGEGLKPRDLQAVAVSQGPGSFTGLRIGVSAAKGMSYALGIPLIALNTLEVLARSLQVADREWIVPVMDARRMEVYSQVFHSDYRSAREIRAEIIDADSFSEWVQEGTAVHLIGDGAGKCREVLSDREFRFHPDRFPSAAQMAPLAEQKWAEGLFEDVAYFEPFYLKEFQGTLPKQG